MKDDLWIHVGSSKTTDANDKEPVELNVPAGNMFWADDQSGQDLDIQFAVNGKKSPVLPKEFSPKATLIPNTVEGTCKSVEVYVNGRGYTVIDRVPTEAINAPGDLKAAIMTCPAKPKNQDTFIRPNSGDVNEETITILKASDSLVLPENQLGQAYNIDELTEEMISALYDTLAESSLLALEVYEHFGNSNRDQNAAATMMVQAYEHGQAYKYYKKEYGQKQAIAYLKELIVGGRFTLNPVKEWKGKLGLAFKGDRKSRIFLTGIRYGVQHDKLQIVSTTLQMAEDLHLKNYKNYWGSVLGDAIPFKGTNIITFVFVASFDVYEFFKKDVGEQNIAEFLGALGMTTAKLFTAGVLASMILSLLVLYLSSIEVVLSGGVLLLAIAGVSFLAGWFVDEVDSHFGIKDNVKSFLKEAFPNLTVENMINKKELDESDYYRKSYYNPKLMTTKWY
ncbi:hypothetical protein [Vibrio sagamiensis]|uniref:Uncharacterized protein n=1 Tax=Vibrio sagamiensis NBRC 104589 TaxID=1219064 RepID=A0A511QM64_9VIBR|nr:hypothetical protein [Vibrio sagamiensis]GEM77602.1 hypothetical protein VSA01S_37140 [Vibrio sagamiensis NBRC 104589]